MHVLGCRGLLYSIDGSNQVYVVGGRKCTNSVRDHGIFTGDNPGGAKHPMGIQWMSPLEYLNDATVLTDCFAHEVVKIGKHW